MNKEKRAKKPKENEQKKVDIFALYQREKKIRITDNEERYTDILIKKLTQKDRAATVALFNRRLTEEKNRLIKDAITQQNIRDSISLFTKEQIIGGIIEIEKHARKAIADIFPVDKEEELSKAEREKKQEEEYEKWHGVREKQLGEKEKIELEELLSELRTSTLATIQASLIFDLACIAYMCYDPETGERIFKDYEEVEKVLDKRIIERLVAEISPLRTAEGDQNVRRLAESEDFLSNGGSASGSTDSPAITT